MYILLGVRWHEMCFEGCIKARCTDSTISIFQAAVRWRFRSTVAADNCPASSTFRHEVAGAMPELPEILMRSLRYLSRCRG